MARKVREEIAMKRIREVHPAEKRGCDELMTRAEYTLRNRPRALKHARQLYREACLDLYACLARHFRGRP
jgi:hypothetical protein